MSDAVTIRGTVLPDGSLRLDGPLSLPPGEVEVTVRPVVPAKSKESLLEFIDRISAEQEASGYVPRSAEEVQKQLHEADVGGDEHEAIHGPARQAQDTPK
jgi:hypothetical protein